MTAKMQRSLKLVCGGVALSGAFAAYIASSSWSGSTSVSAVPPGMVWIPGGEFTMGSDDTKARVDERPTHRIRVDGFWMDKTPVTNARPATRQTMERISRYFVVFVIFN